MEAKKLTILYLLRILAEETDETHKLSYAELSARLAACGPDCERKAVARNVAWLKAAGYDIVTDAAGSYLRGRRFEDGELRLLIDGVLANRYVYGAHAKDLIKRLTGLGSRKLRSELRATVSLDGWQRSENSQFLLNIEAVGDALEQDRKISFLYNAYGADKRLHPRSPIPCVVSPYRLLMHNQRYYLICCRDGDREPRFYRMDYMTDLRVLDEPRLSAAEIPGFREATALGRIDSRFPYLYRDEAVRVELRVERAYIGEIVDWFGFEFDCRPLGPAHYAVTLEAGLSGIRYWLLQYGLHVTALGPAALVEMLRRDTAVLYSAYRGDSEPDGVQDDGRSDPAEDRPDPD